MFPGYQVGNFYLIIAEGLAYMGDQDGAVDALTDGIDVGGLYDASTRSTGDQRDGHVSD